MSYQEKKTIANIVSGVLVLAAYIIYALGRLQAGTADLGDLKFWAITMLIFIGIGIGVAIVIQILFHILFAISVAVQERGRDDKEIEKTIERSTVEDEMDKLIELKSMRVAFIFAGVGFVAGLILLALDSPPAVMLNVLFLSCSAGSLSEGFLGLHYYRKGVKNG